MKQPMKKGSFVPKNVPGVGVGWVMQGCSGSCRGGVGHVGVGWVMQGWVGHVGVGWGGSCSGGVGWVGVCHNSNLVIETNHHYLHTPPSWQLLGITGGAKFNYNHTPNYLELLREQKFNYNHAPKCVKLRPPPSLSAHYTTW